MNPAVKSLVLSVLVAAAVSFAVGGAYIFVGMRNGDRVQMERTTTANLYVSHSIRNGMDMDREKCNYYFAIGDSSYFGSTDCPPLSEAKKARDAEQGFEGFPEKVTIPVFYIPTDPMENSAVDYSVKKQGDFSRAEGSIVAGAALIFLLAVGALFASRESPAAATVTESADAAKPGTVMQPLKTDL